MSERRLARTRATLPEGYQYGDMQTECFKCGMALWIGGVRPECVSPYCHPRQRFTNWATCSQWIENG